MSVYINDGARHTGELVDLGEGHVDLPWPRKTASRLAPAVRAYLAEIGARGKAEREHRVELGHFLRALADRPEIPPGRAEDVPRCRGRGRAPGVATVSVPDPVCQVRPCGVL